VFRFVTHPSQKSLTNAAAESTSATELPETLYVAEPTTAPFSVVNTVTDASSIRIPLVEDVAVALSDTTTQKMVGAAAVELNAPVSETPKNDFLIGTAAPIPTAAELPLVETASVGVAPEAIVLELAELKDVINTNAVVSACTSERLINPVVPSREYPVGNVRCVHVIPSGDVTHSPPAATAQKTNPFHFIESQYPVIGSVLAVHVIPSGDVAAPAVALDTAQNTEPFHVIPIHIPLEGSALGVHVIPSGDVAATLELYAVAQNTDPFHAIAV